MSNPVILTRVRVPQPRKDLLRRPRLLDMLHRNLHRKLTFISAPAGYGKTALLLDFVADLETTVCWYSISPDHADLLTFVQHLVAAFQQEFPSFGQLLPLAGENGAPDPYSLAIAISNEMVSQVNDFCLLVLDDFHLIGEVQTIVGFLETLLAHLPEQVRCVAASRSIYGVPTVPLYVHEELQTLGIKDLRFRADELQALVRQNYHLSLPMEQAITLAQVADGWIIALLLAVRTMENGTMPKLEGTTDQLYAFLADEVLVHQPDYIQDFLLGTSIFDDFNDALCNSVLEIERATTLLPELLERNLFIVPVETADGLAYRYHQLFSDFLRNRLNAKYPKRAQQLHRRAAAWFASKEDWEHSVAHALLAGDRSEAAVRMNIEARSLYVQGRNGLMESWKNSLLQPPSVLAEAPLLALNSAKVLIDNGGSVSESDQLLTLAENVFRQQNDIDQIANVLLSRGALYQRQGKASEALALGQVTESLLGDRRDLRWYQSQHRQGSALSLLGRADASIEYLSRAANGFRELKADLDLIGTLTSLVIAYLECGDIFQAQNCALETVQILRRRGGGSRLANSLNTAGYVVYQAGRYKDAWRFYQESLDIAQSNHSHYVLVHLFSSRGDLLRDIDEWAQSENAYRKSIALSEEYQIADALPGTYLGLSELERLRGNFNEALHWLREATRLGNETTESPTYQLGVGAIYLDMGQAALAKTAFESALVTWNALPRPRPEQVRAEFLLAQACFVVGLQPEALEHLARSLQRAAVLGYDQFLVSAGRRTPDLLEAASGAWPKNPQLQSLIQRIENFSPRLVSLEEAPVVAETRRAGRLELFAFGGGTVRRNGELVPNVLWRSKQARLLFFYIAEKGRATKDEIALTFWPDFSPEKVTSNFHATMWRLRQAVGAESLVFEDDTYALLGRASVWYDVDDFVIFAKRGNDKTLPEEERAEAWRRALDLYQGPFLNGADMDWAEERRRHLENLVRVGLSYLGKWELDRHHYEAAETFYESFLQLDPYSDEAELGLMKSLVGLGDIAGARDSYLAYRKRLATDLKTSPSPALQDLYRQLGPA